jgi:hypothetical protein
MRKNTRLLGVTASALLLIASVTGPADAGTDRPFRGTVAGEVTFVLVDDSICDDVMPGPPGMGLQTRSDATGRFSHMGASTMYSEHCTPSGDYISGGKMTLTAANGDKVYMDYDGTASATPPVGGVLSVEGGFQVKGGTGRFDGAKGGGTYVARVVFQGLDDPAWPGTWTYTGRISY